MADATDDPAAKFALADYYVSVKRNADALAVLEKLSAAPRTWAVARSRTAAVLYMDGKNADAHRAIDEVIAKQPGYSEARVIRARFLLGEGKPDPALADVQEAVKADPRNVEAHFLLGSIQQAKLDLDGAAKSFAEVLRLNPQATAAEVKLAAVELQRGSLTAASELAEAGGPARAPQSRGEADPRPQPAGARRSRPCDGGYPRAARGVPAGGRRSRAGGTGGAAKRGPGRRAKGTRAGAVS